MGTIEGNTYIDMQFHGQFRIGQLHREKVRFILHGTEGCIAGFHIFCHTDSLLKQITNGELVIMLAQLELHLPHLSKLQRQLHKPIADGYNVFTIPTAEQLSAIPRCQFCHCELEREIIESWAAANGECYDEEISVPTWEQGMQNPH